MEEINCYSKPKIADTPAQTGDVDIKYLKGKNNIIANALSCVSPLTEFKNSDKNSQTIDVMPVHQISSTTTVSEQRLLELKQAIMNDRLLRCLTRVIKEGWPTHRRECP